MSRPPSRSEPSSVMPCAATDRRVGRSGCGPMTLHDGEIGDGHVVVAVFEIERSCDSWLRRPAINEGPTSSTPSRRCPSTIASAAALCSGSHWEADPAGATKVQGHQLAQEPQLNDVIADGLSDLDQLAGQLGRGRVEHGVPLDEGDPSDPAGVAEGGVEAQRREAAEQRALDGPVARPEPPWSSRARRDARSDRASAPPGGSAHRCPRAGRGRSRRESRA